jgi:uncharacterized membrane protein YhdT
VWRSFAPNSGAIFVPFYLLFLLLGFFLPHTTSGFSGFPCSFHSWIVLLPLVILLSPLICSCHPLHGSQGFN